MKIFISHSSEDRELVEKFTNLLESAFRIDSREIYCTSVNNNVNIGENFISNIKDNLRDAEAVFFLITENYINSYFCLMELGASWAFKDNIMPILVPPLAINFLKNTPLIPVQAGMINNENDIHNIYEKLIEKDVIERLSFRREPELREGIKRFIEQANRFIYSSGKEVLEATNCLTVVENGDPKALEVKKRDEKGRDIITLSCNFRPNSFFLKQSSFISYVLQFYLYRNFAHSADNCSLCFEIRSENEDITNVTVEIKNGSRLIKIYEEQFKVSNQWEECVIPFYSDNIKAEHLREVAEICFVVKPNFTRELLGVFDISNLRLEINTD